MTSEISAKLACSSEDSWRVLWNAVQNAHALLPQCLFWSLFQSIYCFLNAFSFFLYTSPYYWLPSLRLDAPSRGPIPLGTAWLHWCYDMYVFPNTLQIPWGLGLQYLFIFVFLEPQVLSVLSLCVNSIFAETYEGCVYEGVCDLVCRWAYEMMEPAWACPASVICVLTHLFIHKLWADWYRSLITLLP